MSLARPAGVAATLFGLALLNSMTWAQTGPYGPCDVVRTASFTSTIACGPALGSCGCAGLVSIVPEASKCKGTNADLCFQGDAVPALTTYSAANTDCEDFTQWGISLGCVLPCFQDLSTRIDTYGVPLDHQCFIHNYN